jgi:putative transposase
MPRLPRLVCPQVPHHITQRGNRKQQIFFGDADRRAYLELLRDRCTKTDVKCLAWCLMDNHVHLILVPPEADSLRAVLAPLHTRYAARINQREGWSGHLFEGRYWSYPMDDAHLMHAVRYVERNPVSAMLVRQAEDWRWSSARAHVSGDTDGLTDIAALGQHVPNWRSMLAEGLNSAGYNEAIEKALRRGRNLGEIIAKTKGDSHFSQKK